MQESTAFDEAIEEGEVRGQLKFLLRQGRSKFGPPDSETEARLNSIADAKQLERLADAILSASSWKDLLAAA